MIAFDITIEGPHWPGDDHLRALVHSAIAATSAHVPKLDKAGEVSILFTSDAHIQTLNSQWRGMDKPTNVLSFEAIIPPGMAMDDAPLGDIVLAYETCAREAAHQDKPLDHHIAHLVVHGLLHLSGYDHEHDDEADAMETLEREILAGLSIADPYLYETQ